MYKKIGILGGGQLGRMLLQAALNYPFEIHVLDPNAEAPCAGVSRFFYRGSLLDEQTVYDFGRRLDILTIEIEHVNTQALRRLQRAGVKVFPQPDVIEVVQDKRLQKQFYQQHNIPTAPFFLIDSPRQLWQYVDYLPAVLKLGKGGYDGRGVMLLQDTTDFKKAFQGPCVLEHFAEIQKEVAIIVARSTKGEIRCFPPVEMVFDPRLHLVDYLLAPARLQSTQLEQAEHIARQLIEALDMVGILAVEMFLTKQGEWWVNEVAPRPHNSGHHTIEACYTSQYDQLLRAITDLPLGDTALRSPAIMLNVLGEAGMEGSPVYEGLEEVLQMKGVYIHLYGKTHTKPGRKMGHITLLGDDLRSLPIKAQRIRERFRVKAAGSK